MQDAELEHLFIVSVDEILVARDIEMSIAELFPKARIIVGRTLSEVASQVPQAVQVVSAFVQCDPALFLASSAGQRLVEDGGRLVLVGQDAAPGVQTLPQPFTHNDVEAALAALNTEEKSPRL